MNLDPTEFDDAYSRYLKAELRHGFALAGIDESTVRVESMHFGHTTGKSVVAKAWKGATEEIS